MSLKELLHQKPPILLSKGITKLDHTLSVRDYLHKKVYSTSGDYVGRVYDIVLYEYQLLGLLVRGRKRLFIDINYCTASAVDSIILKVDPVTMLKGKIVFDSRGKRIGKVVAIERKNVKNECENLIVKKNMFKKPVQVPFADIEVSKKNIILSKVFKEK